MYSQQQNFVQTLNGEFFLNGTKFTPAGFNVYYLQEAASYPEMRDAVEDVFRAASIAGLNTVRTWAFNNTNGVVSNAVIQNEPGNYLEEGLRSLDYVISKAREYNIKLVLVFGNNFPEYGGINIYLEWAKRDLNITNPSKKHFFTDERIKNWYKDYITFLVNRVNFYTGIAYKDDTTILAFELMNEAENVAGNYRDILSWYDDLGRHFKSVNTNHLLGTGETGFDNYSNFYPSPLLFWNGVKFLINGVKGTSFFYNSGLDVIDYASVHAYPETWGMNIRGGSNWIAGHEKIALALNKPLLIGEAGIINSDTAKLAGIFEEALKTKSKGLLLWQYKSGYAATKIDRYSFNFVENPGVKKLYEDYLKSVNSPDTVPYFQPASFSVKSFPNPFSENVTVQINLTTAGYTDASVYSITGEKIAVLYKGNLNRGSHNFTLAPDTKYLASGVWFCLVRVGDEVTVHRMMFVK
ncbi:MAG: cellulase family glycosylhydrolase [Ignavibacteriaceae bacterium]|nr:cellulase family glycosylhydrolase [Ignavibacteriaceae bacterium]